MTDIIYALIVGHTVWFAEPDAVLRGSLLETLKVKQVYMGIFFWSIPMIILLGSNILWIQSYVFYN